MASESSWRNATSGGQRGRDDLSSCASWNARGNRNGALEPLPRPGFDEDRRLDAMNDDPRYAPGAELGKAQKAALGIQGLNGRNTASFDPKSTLVRPQMRVLYGSNMERYDQVLKTDDVLMAPGLLRRGLLKRVSTEVDMPGEAMREAVSVLKKYGSFSSLSLASVTVARNGRSKRTILDDRPGDTVVYVVAGDAQEVALQRVTTAEKVYLLLQDGDALLVNQDVSKRFSHGVRGGSSGESVTLEMRGNIKGCVEDTKLGREVERRACSDFKRGNCHYGDKCKFAHEAPAEQSFDVDALPPRPDLRVISVPASPRFPLTVRHDDVIVVPEFFCKENDWDIYYQLIKEMRDCQADHLKKSEWIPWHEGAHLLSQNPTGSRTFQRVIDKCAEYFSIPEGNRGTRFNWYRDGSDWKPFHHDSAAFNEQRARNQNCTVGISFGATRELAFRHAKTGELLYFPQTNGGLFFFGRDANIIWQHGINALPEDEQDGKGRISIVLWGWCSAAVDEKGSPPMLTDDSRGGKGKGKGKGYSMHGGNGKGKR